MTPSPVTTTRRLSAMCKAVDDVVDGVVVEGAKAPTTEMRRTLERAAVVNFMVVWEELGWWKD